jgi:pantoate--beta-alanine ligase
MEIISTIADLRARLAHEPEVAFVPTMGNLHEGHIALVELAKQHAALVVVSIFVNPLQFGPHEDFANYPRTFDADCAKLQEAGAQIVFAPTHEDLYPVPQQVTVEPPPIANELCGAHRPGHFCGVATVVLKLFNIVQPKVAVFGQKDYQQLHVIRQMVQQLNVPVQIVAGETVRAADGLALSSRNGYLTPEQRAEAPRLYRTLQQIAQAIHSGANDFPALEAEAAADLLAHGWGVDYVSVRGQDTLAPVVPENGPWVVMAAAHLGNTRLIDNIEILLSK